MARADKRAYIDELAGQAENAANRGQQGKVYKITKLVCGHMQEKTSLLSKYAHQVGLNISLTKTEVMTLNNSNPQPVKVNGKDLPMTQYNDPVSGQHCQARWWCRHRYPEPAEQSQKHLQDAEQCVAVITVQYTYQAQDLSKLCPVYPFVWVRMLANVRK
ncbi:hypothetical protein ACROYT_G022407 [Oculina patagonica]